MRAVRPLLLVMAFISSGWVVGQTPPNVSTPIGVPNLSGCWSGCWFSCKNGHKGPLSAEICQLNETCYQVTFRGRFWKILPFRYTTTMTVTGVTPDGQVMLSSSQQLGPILGTFCMTAVASHCRFEANFNSRNDWGKFVMTRD